MKGESSPLGIRVCPEFAGKPHEFKTHTKPAITGG